MFCEQCGNEIGLTTKFCSVCGTKVGETYQNKDSDNQIKCPYCGKENKNDSDYCEKCSMRISQYRNFYNNEQVPKIVTGLSNSKKTMYRSNIIQCPRCRSINVQYMTSDIIGRKVKGKTTLNLNPLKPFTMFNHKEKVVSNGYELKKWHCMGCGNIFDDNAIRNPNA